MSREDGQATVELVVLLPFLLLLAVAAASLFAWQAAGEQAGLAAEAGAMALVQGTDPRAAARRALPAHAHATVEVRGRRVTVQVRPGLALRNLARRLTATATADAGPTGAAP
jgi:hypothetical protein